MSEDEIARLEAARLRLHVANKPAHVANKR